MIRKAATVLFVMLLAMQPLVLIVGFAANEDGMLSTDASPQLAQEAGSRFDSLDYTDHVPVIIDDASDWTSQGWPGAGTQGDPYIISGLRIHYDVGIPLIQVTNQEVYFVVRDCLLIQNWTTYAVEFQNTTHAMIEYTTVYSEAVGIYCNNASNTILDHVFGEGNGACDYTAYLNGSLDAVISNCQFNSIYCGAILTMYCHNLTLASNTLEGYTVGFRNLYSNYTSCDGMLASGPDTSYGVNTQDCFYSSYSNIEVYECGTGIYGAYVDFISLTDCSVEATFLGVYLGFSFNVSVSNSVLNAWDGIGATIEQCHYALFSGNNLTNEDKNLSGLRWIQCENGTITGSSFTEIGATGIHVDTSFNVMVSNNLFDSINSYAIRVDDTDNVTLTNNEYYRIAYWAVGVYDSDFIEIISEYMDDIAQLSISLTNANNGLIQDCTLYGHPNWVGIVFFSGVNWTIQDNLISTNWKPITHFGFGGNIKILRNTLLEGMVASTASMIELLHPYDFEIVNNTIANCSGYAVNIVGGQRGLIEGNMITNTYEGIHSGTANLTVIGNSVHNIEKTAINIAGVINPELLNNDLEGGEYGVYLNGASSPLLSGNTIQNTQVGIHCISVSNGIIENNNLTNCGFSFFRGSTLSYYNHTIANNYVNDLPFYYNLSGVGLILDADSYGQIMLVNCTNSAISSGEIVNATYGIMLFLGNSIDIISVILTAHNTGALFDRATNVSLVDCVFSDSQFMAHYAHDFLVDNLTIQDGGESSSIYDTQNFQILNCLLDEGTKGFYIWDSQDGFIEGNRFFMGGKIGVWLATSSQDIEIYDNEFKWCNVGVYGEGAFNINITLNNFHDNGVGAYSVNGNNWRITNNTFFANEYTGLWLDNAVNPFIVDNSFMNIDEDGREDVSTNFWDNGVDTGNYWYVFPLVSPYPIEGSGGSTDRYPMSYDGPTEPMLNEPRDIEYAEFAEGNEIIWIVADDNPREWEVYVDGEFWAGDAWNFGNITVNIDGLSYGAHTVELIVWDLSNNNATDVVLVTVIDNTDPGISSPSNAIIFVGVSGNEISWTISDQNPDSFELYQDDVLVNSGSWWSTPWTYSHDLDGLAEGEYTFTLAVYDVDGNKATDEVLVYVLGDDMNPVINHPDDINMTEGTIGNYIIWAATDDFPSHYVVVENASVAGTGDWGGTSVSLNIDGLPAGYYTFVITVYDSSGNSATDSVNVIVIPEGGTPPIAPPDYTLAIVAVLGAAGVIAVVVVLIMRKKKTSAA